MPTFIVATEGKTADGRTISGRHLEQMAKNYDPQKYAARVWLEHIRSIFFSDTFPPLGDVLSLSLKTNSEGKKQLLADIQPLPLLVEMNHKGQKMYTSVEINPNFADTGEAYLVGLAVTDSPASLGTQRLQFSSEQVNPQNLFSSFSEIQPMTTTTPEQSVSAPQGFSATVRNMFTSTAQAQAQQISELEAAVTQTVEHFTTEIGEMKKTVNQLAATVAQFTASQAPSTPATPAPVPAPEPEKAPAEPEPAPVADPEPATEIAQLHAEISQLQQEVQTFRSQEATPARPTATGGNDNNEFIF